ncbi:hypothetical protein F4809DRAFT_144771 [Biscogniauxia mediterranea]|nr:hypothetical protein F4809DRAFT_144771 [Biscogniauxia mediterranea]
MVPVDLPTSSFASRGQLLRFLLFLAFYIRSLFLPSSVRVPLRLFPSLSFRHVTGFLLPFFFSNRGYFRLYQTWKLHVAISISRAHPGVLSPTWNAVNFLAMLPAATSFQAKFSPALRIRGVLRGGSCFSYTLELEVSIRSPSQSALIPVVIPSLVPSLGFVRIYTYGHEMVVDLAYPCIRGARIYVV